MRVRVVAFTVLCAVAAAALLWLALGRGAPEPAVETKGKPAIVARQVDRAPEIGADQRAPAPAAEPVPEIAPDDAPVVAVLDILEALGASPESE